MKLFICNYIFFFIAQLTGESPSDARRLFEQPFQIRRLVTTGKPPCGLYSQQIISFSNGISRPIISDSLKLLSSLFNLFSDHDTTWI